MYKSKTILLLNCYKMLIHLKRMTVFLHINNLNYKYNITKYNKNNLKL